MNGNTVNERMLVRAIARAARQLDPDVPLTGDGDGFVQITAICTWTVDGVNPDRSRTCGEWPDGNGWIITVADHNARMIDNHHMILPDEHYAEDAGLAIGALLPAVCGYTRDAAYQSGWRDPHPEKGWKAGGFQALLAAKTIAGYPMY